MKVLPLTKIWPEDVDQFGLEVVNLAKIYHHGLPVPEGIAVSAPVELIAELLKKVGYQEGETSHLANFETLFLKTSCPKELEDLVGVKIDCQRIWQDLAKEWLLQLKSLIQRGVKDPVARLSAKYCLFASQIEASGRVFYSSDLKNSQIIVDQGDLSPRQRQQLNDYLGKLKQLFLLSYSFDWIVDQELKFSRVVPSPINLEQPQTEPEVTLEQPLLPLVTKLFLRLSDSYTISHQCDGFLVEVDRLSTKVNRTFLLVELASSFPDKKIIYKLADLADSFGGSRGSYRLLHDTDNLESQVESFLFARNNHRLSNIDIALPFIRSRQEFDQIKRTLVAIGVARKGSLKLWLEVAVPENLLNIEDYLISGLDGVILNLDQLGAWLNGFDPDSPDAGGYSHQFQAIEAFLGDNFRLLHRSKVPVLAVGRLIGHDDVQKFLVSQGGWGLAVDRVELETCALSLAKAEKALAKSRLT